MGPVLGAQNPRIVELRRLLGRRNSRSELIVIEGPRTVREVCAAGHRAETVIVPETFVDDPAVVDVRNQIGAETEWLVVRDHVFERLAPSPSPQPMLALVARPHGEFPQLDQQSVVLVLAEVSDPGNVGTLVRAADAVGAAAVVLVGGADPWAPKALRASAGSMLRRPIVVRDVLADAVDELRELGMRVVGSDVRSGRGHDSGVLTPPLAIMVGSEPHGLDPTIEVDDWVHIAMPGQTESLNVAMAGTLLLFETRRGASTTAEN
jgi:TrmH family RNA methyltransferase